MNLTQKCKELNIKRAKLSLKPITYMTFYYHMKKSLEKNCTYEELITYIPTRGGFRSNPWTRATKLDETTIKIMIRRHIWGGEKLEDLWLEKWVSKWYLNYHIKKYNQQNQWQ